VIEAGTKPENILVRGDSAFCAGKLVATVVNAEAICSRSRSPCNPSVDAAVVSIPEEAL
jgi:hypothetical protein